MSSNAVFFDIIYAGEHGSCLKLPSESRITGSEKSAYHMGAGGTPSLQRRRGQRETDMRPHGPSPEARQGGDRVNSDPWGHSAVLGCAPDTVVRL